jgi:cytochrome c peroxidase
MNRIVALAMCMALFSCTQERKDPLIEISKYTFQEATSLEKVLVELQAGIEANKEGVNVEQAQKLFSQARIHYKRIEGIVEFHFPGVAEAFNGPALPEADEYDDKVVEPSGFQVVEEMLFATIDTANRKQLIIEMKLFVSMMARLKGQLESNSWVAENIFEASRLELLRIMSLGITGFDSPVAFHSIQEAREALNGMKKITLSFENQAGKKELANKLKTSFDDADKFLSSNTDFNTFNRGEFIIDYIKPLSESLYDFQKACKVPNNKWLAAVDMSKTNFASPSTIEPMWFAPTYNRELKNKEGIASLGKLLFFDPALSGNNSRSCASCHQPSKGFTDGKVKSVAFNSDGNIERNAPTIINSGFQKAQFADSRFQFLEDQITDVLSNKKEMHGQIAMAAKQLQKSQDYQELFSKAFGDTTKNSVSKERVQISIATCHFMPLFNGSIPPSYLETESEIIGVPAKPDTARATLDSDIGKFRTFNRELHKNAFKIPTVRNAALTAPYMHNGVYQTLEEVIDFYNRGGGIGIGIKLENQTLPPDPLQLSKKEKEQIVLFIHALTDTVGLTSIPSWLPRFKDEKMDARKIGGEY